jgi:Mor family transcriptional regulator
MPDNWLSELADELTMEDLPENYRIVAEICGMESAVKLSQQMSSLTIYVPSFDKLTRDRRDERIRAEFTGFNLRPLAQKYGLSETWIREIVQRKPADVTVDMFEEKP